MSRMNPQANRMNQDMILDSIIKEINVILSRNSPKTMSSYELLISLPIAMRVQIADISKGFNPNCTCARDSSYVGTAASMLANSNKNIIHDRHYFCPVVNRFDDGFRSVKIHP